MGIAVDTRPQEFPVLFYLGVGVQAAARVIEIDVALRIEPRVIGGAQRVDGSGRPVLGVSGENFSGE